MTFGPPLQLECWKWIQKDTERCSSALTMQSSSKPVSKVGNAHFSWDFLRLELIDLYWSDLSTWTAVQGGWRGKTQPKNKFPYAISYASHCEVQSATRMWTCFTSETFKEGWTRSYWAPVPNQQGMSEIQRNSQQWISQTSSCYTSVFVPALRPHKIILLQRISFPFLSVILKFVSSGVNCACQWWVSFSAA